jgi:hypothetical protein
LSSTFYVKKLDVFIIIVVAVVVVVVVVVVVEIVGTGLTVRLQYRVYGTTILRLS